MVQGKIVHGAHFLEVKISEAQGNRTQNSSNTHTGPRMCLSRVGGDELPPTYILGKPQQCPKYAGMA